MGVLQLIERAEKLARGLRVSKRVAVESMPLLAFGLKYFKHHFTNTTPDFHIEFVAELEALPPGKNACFVAPRGSAKSTWMTLILPIYKAVYRQKRYIIILGDTQPNSNLFLSHIAGEFENNDKLQEDFPECRPGNTWRSEAIELTNGVRIEAMGYGKGKIRGRRAFGFIRPDLILIDDPQNDDDACSPDVLKKDEQWLNSGVMNAGGPDTNVIIAGTALVDGCLVLQVQKNYPTWKKGVYKSLIASPINMHLWDKWWDILCRHEETGNVERAEQWYLQHQSGEGGMDFGAQVLWPDRVPLKELMLKKYSNPRAFASEQQGEPMPPGESYWPVHYFDWDGIWFNEWPVDVTSSGYAIDPSVGEDSDKGDFQATGRGVRTRADIIYIEAWLERVDCTVMSELLVDRYVEMPLEAVGLEVNGFQQLLKVPIANAVKAKSAQLKIPLLPIENYGIRKFRRIIRLTELLASRKIRFRDTPGTRLLVDQLKKFPYADHDDGPDMLEMLMRVMMMINNAKVKR